MKNRVENQIPAGKTNRFMELEGLRVIAAIVVVFYHALLIFYPGFFYGVGTLLSPVRNARLETVLYQHPLAGLLSGTFAVGIFFVLSGFVLSIGYFKKKDPSVIVRLASKRYLRLMLPALGSVLLVWLILKLRLDFTMDKATAVTHSVWLAHIWGFPPHFFDAFYQAAVGIFMSGKTTYNPVLWSITNEFIGSFLVFGVAFLFSGSRYRWLVYGILLVALANTWLLAFIIGMILADIYANKEVFFERLNHKLTYLLVLAGIVLGGYPSGPTNSVLYKAISIPGFNLAQQISFHVIVGSTLVVVGVLALPRLKRFMAHRWISGLGKYTYSLYLIHMPVLFTVCTGVFVVALPIGFHKASVVAIIAAGIALIPVTYLFEKYIDSPSIRFASFCTDIYLGRRELDWKEKYARFRLYIAAKLSMLKRREVSEIMPEIEAE